MANLIYNERIKLRATLFNNCAVACLVAGFLVPFINPIMNGGLFLFTASIGLTFGAAFHTYAHFYLANLRE